MDLDKIKEWINPKTEEEKKNPFEGNIEYRDESGRDFKKSNFVDNMAIDERVATDIAKKNLPKDIHNDSENINYININLNKFKTKEITYKNRKAYLITVIDGDYLSRVIDNNGLSHEYYNKITENNDINCLVYRDNGEYEYVDKNKIWNFRNPSLEVFK